MRSCVGKRRIYNTEITTKENESTLVNTTDNLFCSFIKNDDANIALHHLAIKMKILNCVILL